MCRDVSAACFGIEALRPPACAGTTILVANDFANVVPDSAGTMFAADVRQIFAAVIAALPQVVRQRAFTDDKPTSASTASDAKIVSPN